MNTHVAFFGDADRTFALTPELIIELERKIGMGIGSLCLRVPEGHFKHADLVEITRLALIGGGTTPQEAAALADTYAAKRPLNEPYALATAILQMIWSGTPAPKLEGEASANG
ncbi:gene transfer agent family protein [Mesorhizobium sp.]|uniref:gene transfer agent family protein n=1 Tax=Mesorhizobium sp. TaxID=1871066 RepID=UPI000FE5BFCE|nr:gene transfer agent family protein [Mesorhizobium sp.]RWI22053.1 MAG: gene transfer agent family protein [Mesorhizobium sp.]RWK46100.1 MAG: gene transfer agent family protein [Mesorhizobium sp.]RWK92339.1 MAG: gene transfer agent family protein [Mesorhizobium sp.]TIP54698.1 MAG: gene transfer agent family protein [Mesorhizobium sp.]TIP95103.1 MAG: gene transfer agent family protein [Mesorhizobium sp.]